MFRGESRLDKFTLDVVTGSPPHTSHRSGIVRRANGEQEDYPPPTKAEQGYEASREYGLVV